MPGEGVAAAVGRPHGGDHLHVDQPHREELLALVPTESMNPSHES